MSTIVVPRNNGNWVADAVVNFVGPIIGDWIKSEREKEINRKNNVAIHEAIKSLGLGNNDYSNLPPSMPNNNGGLLGGSSNGWENASRNMSDNPLTQFDTNTADIAPSVNAPATSTPNLPTQQHIPTPAEFLQTMYNVVGSNPKRFGLVNMENLQKLAAPIMAAYQADLTRQEKQKLADDFLNAAGDYAKQRNIMTSGYINGTVPYEAVNGATHNYEYENPHLIPGSYNAGGESYFYGYNPRTGEYNFNTQVNNSLTPQQKQQGEQWDREYGLKVRQQDFLENQARIARENPELKPQYGEDGTLYYVNPYTGKAVYAQNPDGEIIKVDPDSYSKRTPVNKNDNAFINYKKEENRQLQMTIRQKEKAIADPTVSEEIKERYRKEIDEHKAQIELNNKEITERTTNSKSNSQNNSKNSNARYIYPNGETAYTDYDIALAEEKIRNGGTISDKNGNPIDTVEKFHAWLRSQGLIDLQNQNQTSTTPSNEPQNTTTQNSGNNSPQTTTPSQNIQVAPSQTTNTAKRTVSPELDWRPSYQRMPPSVAMTAPPTNVGNSPFLTDEEKQRAATQGNTGSNIARVPEAQNEAVLNGDKTPSNSSNNDEYNSEIAWTHPDGRTISLSEYNNRLKLSGMENPDYDAQLEAEGYRRADNSHSPAPEGTDVINGTTPYAMQNQVNLLNGDYSPEVTGSTFMGETLPGISPHGVMATSLTPIGLNGGNPNNHVGTPVYIPNNKLNENNEPPAYNPYDVNADTGQPYDENDAYEQGFEYDDDASNGIVTPKVNNTGYNVLPIADLSNPAPRPTDSGNYLPPVGQRGGNHKRTLPPVGQTYSEIPAQDNTPRNAPKTSQQTQNNNQQTTYRDARIPKREARRPGKIKTNTSYQDLKPIVDDSAKRHGLEPELVRAIIQVESKWDSNALSHVGAKGLMQLMPNTAREVGVRDAYDVAQNINGGSKYIAQLIRMFKGNVAHALMAYNWGPGNMRAALKGRKSIPEGVRKYARNILNIYNSIKSRRGR